MPWLERRCRYLEAAFGDQAEFAGTYLDTVESFLNTGDPHWRTVPFSNAGNERLAACSAFLAATLAEVGVRRRAPADRARRRSFQLLAHHARLLQFIVKAHIRTAAGAPRRANEQLDRAAAFLRRGETTYAAEVDVDAALRLCVDLHRPV